MSFASPRRLRTRLLGGVAVGACALAGVAATSGTSEAANGPTMDIQILSFNDFHGNLEPPAGSSGRIVIDHAARRRRRQRVDVDVDTPTPPGVGGVEYLATHLAQARAGPPEHADRRRRRHRRRLAAAVGRVPRRADHRGDERARPRRHRRGQPRVRRGLQGAAAAWPTAAASTTVRRREQPELLRRRHPFKGADFHVPRRQRQVRGHRQDDPAGLHGQERQRRQDRLHRHDAQGHADHRHRVRRRRAGVHRRGRDRQRARARAAQARASTRSSCSSTRAASRPAEVDRPGRQAVRRSTRPTTPPAARASQLDPDSPIIPIAKGLDPAIDMVISGHTHQPYVCDIPDPDGPAAPRHLGVVVRPALHRDRR